MPLDILKTVELSYDYTRIPAADRDAVQQAAMEIKPRLARAGDDIFTIGAQLNEIKERLPHGEWHNWLENEFDLTDRTAQRFMNVAERLSGKSDNLSDLTPSALYLLAAPSTPDEVIETVATKVEAGQRVTYSEVKSTINAAKPTATVDDLTRHVGSWISGRSDPPRLLLTQSATRGNVYRRDLESLLKGRDIAFTADDLDQAIDAVLTNVVNTNVVNTNSANTNSSSPRPPVTGKDLDEIENAKPQPPMYAAGLPMLSIPILEPEILPTAEEMEAVFSQHEADGWKILRGEDAWQAIHHRDQVATPVLFSANHLYDALDDGNFAEEFYFLEPVTEEATSPAQTQAIAPSDKPGSIVEIKSSADWSFQKEAGQWRGRNSARATTDWYDTLQEADAAAVKMSQPDADPIRQPSHTDIDDLKISLHGCTNRLNNANRLATATALGHGDQYRSILDQINTLLTQIT